MEGEELLSRYRQRASVGVYVLLVPWVFAATTHHRAIDLLLEIALGVNVLIWCLLDARIHDKSFQHAFVLPFLATWPVSLAVHLVWTRGARGLVSYAMALVVAAVVLLLAAVLGSCFSIGQAPNP
jgi:hypothetical protein